MTYELISAPDRVSAVNTSGVEICGAYRPLGHQHWLLYLTMLPRRATGITVQHQACFYDHGDGRARADAKAWVETIAALYTAVPQAPSPVTVQPAAAHGSGSGAIGDDGPAVDCGVHTAAAAGHQLPHN